MIDELLNVAMACFTAATDQNCAPFLSPGSSEDYVSEMLLPRDLLRCQQ